MKVNLKRNFWDNELQWLSNNNPQEMPDEMRDRLPRDAEIIDGSGTTESKASTKAPKKAAE